MKNIKRLISLILIITSVWIIKEGPFYLVAEYPMIAAIIICLIIYFSFVLGLSTISVKNKTLNNVRMVIIVIAAIGIIPGIIVNVIYFKKAKNSFLVREGIASKAIVTDKKISSVARRSHESTEYELFFSFLTSEKIISKSWDVVSVEEFQTVNVGDSVNIIYLPSKSEIVDLILSQADRTRYATKLRSSR